MADCFIIVIGASSGGVSALCSLTAGLKVPLPAPILIVLHIGALRSELPALLNSAGATPAKHAEDGEVVKPGQIYVAPPDRHMLVVDGFIRLTRGPKENWARPAIDPLFQSVAEGFGPAAVGVILTGSLNDGTAGLYQIKKRGGIAIVQDPNEAVHPEMPRSAATNVDLDYCLPLREIPALLKRIVAEGQGVVMSSTPDEAAGNGHETIESERFDRPITITCPDCGGALRRSASGTIVKYACHIGHSYTAEVMAAAQFDYMEKVMRAAERMLNERAEFCRQMGERASSLGEKYSVAVWHSASSQARDRAYVLRDFINQDWIIPRQADSGTYTRGSAPLA